MSLASRVNISANGATYTMAPDDVQSAVDVLQLLIGVSIIDELTNLPMRTELVASSDAFGGEVVVAAGGLVGLVGTPLSAFSQLALSPYTVNFHVESSGYVDLDFAVSVPTGATFPIGVSPALQLSMHRSPVVLNGRVMRPVGGVSQPVAGATVAVSGYWRQVPPANATIAATATNFLSVWPPLYANRASAMATMDVVALTPVAGSDQPLTRGIDAIATAIALPTSAGIAAGDVLAIDVDLPDRTEIMQVASAAAGAVTTTQTNITLVLPTIWAHRGGATVRKMAVGAPTASQPLSLDCQRGDVCLFLNSLAGLSATQTVRVWTAGSSEEFHQASQLTATTDANGLYRLPPLSRAAQVQIDAKLAAPPLSAQEVLCVDYGGDHEQLDFSLA